MYALQSFHSGKEQFNEIIKSHFKAITNHYHALNVKVSNEKKKPHTGRWQRIKNILIKKVNRTTASQSRKRSHASNENGLFSTGKLFQSDGL